MLRICLIFFVIGTYLLFESFALTLQEQEDLLKNTEKLDKLLNETTTALRNDQAQLLHLTREIERNTKINQDLLFNKAQLEEHVLNIIRNAPNGYHNNLQEFAKYIRREFRKIDASHHWHCIVGPKLYFDFSNNSTNHVFVTWQDNDFLLVNIRKRH
ncbi:hypothetical protein KR044_005252 [Drosophila immigrans]|nr:hypothetical protein KR044_005252 [Drosophila immigrans]